MESAHDIVIVGGGPAGCAAALALRAHAPSLSVAVVEASSYDGVRIGEDLPAPARRILTHLGVWDAFSAQGHCPVYGSASTWGRAVPSERESLFTAGGHGWHLDRLAFDRMLRGQAECRGAAILRGRSVRGVCRVDDGWHVALGDGFVLSCRFLVDATGRSALIARKYRGRRTMVDRLVGFGRYFASAPGADPRTFVEPFADGWWYTSGLPGGRRVVACFTDADLARSLRVGAIGDWDALWGETSMVRETVSGIGGPIVVRPTESRCFERAAGYGWLAVGDAASVYDPLSSRGLAKALRTGVFGAYAAADYVERGDNRGLRRYDRFVASSFAAYDEVRRQYYRDERRWPDRPFWRRRHREGVAPSEISLRQPM